ncbi:carcinoembryonic antigen-related cell adhesion molecule 8-like [Dermochelys coriacea]|uniref:carcinoembryonic antigen-related cell adhesion molecule 8-like n=1 Tax=Dermochelys coriacea TaxID=27794 RepID=UPI001CA91D1B|nr:carcinoembryonic antigen-related cell adhesion molecule 8-like [Dermochelys coriacea]
MGRIPHRLGSPWTGIFLAASILGSCLQPALAQTPTPVTIVLTPPSPVVGGGISLVPQNPPQDFLSCSWYQSATADGNSRILTYDPGTPLVQTNGLAHTGRETAGLICSLHIAGLTLNNTGNYTVQIQSPTSPVPAITVYLRVSEMLPRPTVTPDQVQVLENGTFTLMCNSSPRADTVLWLQDGVSLTPSDRLGLSPDNRTLTVLGVTRGDASAHQCKVRKLISTKCSEPSTVTVAYGPDSTRIDPPGPINLTFGSLLNLTCVTDSVPAPSYRWVLNGTDMKKTGTSLSFSPTTWPQHGTYECLVHNPVTSRTAWASVAVWVMEILPRPTVTPNQTQVLENGTFTLTCNSSPSTDTLLWLRDGVSLAPSDQLRLSPDNRTLTVLGVTRGDASAHQCEVRKPVSTKCSEPSTVMVAYGPDSTRIDAPGPITLTFGSPLTLTCVADSVPAPSYRWVLNGINTNETGTSLTFNPTTWAQQGTYECQAHNPVTSRTAWASVAVSNPPHNSPPDAPCPGLSAGTVTGIIIGSLVGAALVGVRAYFLYSRCRNGTPKENGAPVLVYENLPPTAGVGPVAQPGSPPDPSPLYQTLQPRQPDVYKELK